MLRGECRAGGRARKILVIPAGFPRSLSHTWLTPAVRFSESVVGNTLLGPFAGVVVVWEEGTARASVLQWDGRAGCSWEPLPQPISLGRVPEEVEWHWEQGSGSLALHRAQPGTGISLGRLTLVSLSTRGVVGKSQLRHGRQSWSWASPCMTQHETCVCWAWQPLLGAKGSHCMDLVAPGTSADPAPGVPVGRGIP